MRNVTCFAMALAVMHGVRPTCAAETPEKYRGTVAKGLAWLVKQQHKDGHWSAEGGKRPVAMTSLAGGALLLEGSTPGAGKYADPIRRATTWLLQRGDDDNPHEGLIGDPSNPLRMQDHGHALSFLAQVFGEVDDKKVRDRIHARLRRGVTFSAAAQSTQGGWRATTHGDDMTDLAVTVVMLHGLRDVRNAGIAVPGAVLHKARRFLKEALTPAAGKVYSTGRLGIDPGDGERPALTAAALAVAFNEGEATDPLRKKWLKYCQTTIPLGGRPRIAMDEFLHYYYAPVVYRLGDKGWATLFPAATREEPLTWSVYRRARFDFLMATQAKDGRWQDAGLDPVHATALHLTVLQQDNTPCAISR